MIIVRVKIRIPKGIYKCRMVMVGLFVEEKMLDTTRIRCVVMVERVMKIAAKRPPLRSPFVGWVCKEVGIASMIFKRDVKIGLGLEGPVECNALKCRDDGTLIELLSFTIFCMENSFIGVEIHISHIRC